MNYFSTFIVVPLLLLGCSISSAQSKLNYSTSTNFKLKPYFIGMTLPSPVGSRGGNKVWNYSKATETNSSVQGYYNCATQTCHCPSGYDFETLISPIDGCYKIKQDGLYRRTGAATKDTDILYLPFAFSYGDQMVYKYRRQQRSTPAPITDGIGVDSTIAYAWGTITTPLSGPTPALVVKRISSTSDTGLIDPFHSGVPYEAVMHTREVQYVWYSLNDGSYLFVVDSVFTMQVPGKGTWDQVHDGAGVQSNTESVGVNEENATTVKLICYPNPASDNLTILLPAAKNNDRARSLALRNALGQIVFKVENDQMTSSKSKLMIDTRAFARGIYTLHLHSQGQQVVQKISLR